MKSLFRLPIAGILILMSTALAAQEESTLSREIQLGALFASGNTEEQSINFAGAIGLQRDKWEYRFTLDGLYSSSENEVNGQRVYAVGSANYEFSEDSYFLTRLAHEDDRFSGFDSQSDITFNYGRGLLQSQANMELTLNAGVGVRWSRLEDSDFDEPIIRLAGDYSWNISDTATFRQTLSTEAGSETDIYRSESSIETEIMDNLSLRFSVKIKHQSEVPIDKEKTDTETAITLVMSF